MSKTIAEKLQIKPHTTVCLSDPVHLPLLTPLPEGVREVASDERWSALRFRANRPGEGRFTGGQ